MEYKRSGIASVPTYSFSGSIPALYATVTVDFPFTPPSGWAFSITPHVVSSAPVMIAFNSSPGGTAAKNSIFIMATHSGASLKSIAWRLVKI